MILHFCYLNSSCSIQNLRFQLNNPRSPNKITFFRSIESSSMAAPKGKQGTKGAKQIVEENTATLHFYRNMALGSIAASLLLNFIFFELSKLSVIMSVVTVATLLGAYQFMAFMSRAKLSDTGAVLDSGNDLNMEGGIAENAKDLIILSSGTLLLALLSNYFWFLLLLVPIRAVWMLWGTVIQPWLASRNEVEPETDEKKQRKMERKMRRMR